MNIYSFISMKREFIVYMTACNMYGANTHVNQASLVYLSAKLISYSLIHILN